jgi:hypothetical protein
MTRNVLTRTTVIAVVDALRATTEKLDGGMCKYLDGLTDVSLAKRLSDETGSPVSQSQVRDLRQELIGHLNQNVRRPSTASAETDALRALIKGQAADFEALRTMLAATASAVTGQGQAHAALAKKVEQLREVIMHFDLKQHERRGSCTAKLRSAIGHARADERVVRTQLRGDGFSDEEITLSLYMAGAVVRQNGAGSTLELPR